MKSAAALKLPRFAAMILVGDQAGRQDEQRECRQQRLDQVRIAARPESLTPASDTAVRSPFPRRPHGISAGLEWWKNLGRRRPHHPAGTALLERPLARLV